MDSVRLPGRLGDPARTLGTDVRADSRLVGALEQFGLAGPALPLPLTSESPLDEILGFCIAAEDAFGQLFEAVVSATEPVEDVVSETTSVEAADGSQIQLFVHRPAHNDGILPGLIHTHGGGMSILTAADANYRHWRETLASLGLVVVGVEFRNGAGRLGPHPFPAGLDDCVAAVRLVLDQRDRLKMSHVVLSGESGGANLALATAIRAKREGWIGDIAGIYAQCPYISGLYASPPAALVSIEENDGYFIGTDLLAIMARTYDPDGRYAKDPLAWPSNASEADLKDLPPLVISVNELDPLRDEGLDFARRARRAGVSVVSRTVNGTPHAGDVLFPGAIPDVYAASARDVVGFVRSLG